MYELQMQQQFKASQDQLFDACCNVDAIKRWFAPGEMTVPEAQADVRIGGRYRVVMQESDGTRHRKRKITNESIRRRRCNTLSG